MIFILLLPSIEERHETFDKYIDRVYPYSGIDPASYANFCEHITKCKDELQSRPQISKHHFYIAMKSLHDMEVQEPEMTPIIQDTGREIEQRLIYEHKRYGLHMFPQY